MDKSASGTTVVVAVARLSLVSGSVVAAETDAVLVSVPVVEEPTCTTTSTVATVAPGRIPRLHVIVAAPEHDPLLGVDETSVTPAGSVSTSVTPLVVEGPAAVPLFVTVRW